ncbi:hypothetical protein QBC44DRAFT_322976 [Cladorrhinum sp. PSN332]|nr:hypothetical protein QBC44DRAFT_322976 [Cladorrhinum sp. PSN332]
MPVTRDSSETSSPRSSVIDTPLSTSTFSFRFPSESPSTRSHRTIASVDTPVPSIEFPQIGSASEYQLNEPRPASGHARSLSDVQENLRRFRVNSQSSGLATNARRSLSRSQTPSRLSSPPQASAAGTESSLFSQYRAINLHPDDTFRLTSTPRRSISPSHTSSRVSTPLQASRAGTETLAAQIQSLSLHQPDTPSPARARRTPESRRSSSQVPQQIHDVADEESPDNPFHQPEFQTALRDAKALMSNVADVIGSGSLHHDAALAIHRLYGRAQRLARFESAASRTVAFVGDSGVGKSSVLNSLLDVKGLAPASSGGSACTSVATEYLFRDNEAFAVEVTPFSESELRTQLSGLIESYRLYKLHKNDIQDREERKLAEEQFRLATDTFQAMFRGRMQDGRFILDNTEEGVLEIMMGWARECGWQDGSQDHTFTDAEECSSLLAKLNSAGRQSREPASWPYTKKISVFLKAHVLRSGLILVDLPGLRDLNSARQRVTERYLIECDEIFVVCQRSRATSDAGVQAVFELAKQARLSNVGIICTNSDDVKLDEAVREWEGATAREIKRQSDEIASAEEDLANLKERREELEDELMDLCDEEKDELLELGPKVRGKKSYINMLKFRLHHYLVTIRNGWVISKLKRKYQIATAPEFELQVHCVSNSHYWDHRHEAKSKSLPYLELSGIISLRRHCASLVSQAQHRLAKRYIQDEIPGFLGELELWIQAGSTSAEGEGKKLIREVVDKVASTLWENLDGDDPCYEELTSALMRKFRAHILNARNVPRWTSKAKEASDGWSADFSPQSYIAFCRQQGDHSTKLVGYRNWNQEAIEAMSDDLDQPWNELQAAADKAMGKTEKTVQVVFKAAISCLDNIAQYPAVANTLRKTLNPRSRLLLSALEDLRDGFVASLARLRTDALSGIQTSIFRQSMNDTYRKANLEHGTGSVQRRKRIIESTLGSQEIFHTQVRELRQRFRVLVDGLEEKVNSAVCDHLGDIDKVLDIVRNENEVAECEVDLEFRSRVKGVVEGVVLEMRRIEGWI